MTEGATIKPPKSVEMKRMIAATPCTPALFDKIEAKIPNMLFIDKLKVKRTAIKIKKLDAVGISPIIQ